jgi:hypothetical protein
MALFAPEILRRRGKPRSHGRRSDPRQKEPVLKERPTAQFLLKNNKNVLLLQFIDKHIWLMIGENNLLAFFFIHYTVLIKIIQNEIAFHLT